MRPRPVDFLLRPFQRFARLSSAGGIVLLFAAGVALVWANSPGREHYFAIAHADVGMRIEGLVLQKSLGHWINDGLMAVFFLLVGLEIKREVLAGELSTPGQAALPVLAAAGGMLVPAGLYALLNAGTAGARGFGIPMATDIAFALGVLTFLGKRIPLGLKVFLSALAIADDLGAILVIACFYSGPLSGSWLAVAAGFWALLWLLNWMQVRRLSPYLLLAFGLWSGLLRSGVHATLAGVLLALTIPASAHLDSQRFATEARRLLAMLAPCGHDPRPTGRQQQEALHALEAACRQATSPLLALEHALQPAVTFLVMPVFAFVNAGVAFTAVGAAFTSSITQGIGLGLLAGKLLGVFGASWLAVRCGIARLPEGVTWRQILGASLLAGIGFTMSLFVASLAFGEGEQMDQAKVGILIASTMAGLLGYAVLRAGSRLLPPHRPPTESS